MAVYLAFSGGAGCGWRRRDRLGLGRLVRLANLRLDALSFFGDQALHFLRTADRLRIDFASFRSIHLTTMAIALSKIGGRGM